MTITRFMSQGRSKQKLRRAGFAVGLAAGVLFLAYKEFKYSGSINRSNAMLCVALILSFGLAGGLVGWGLGALFGSSDGGEGQ